MIGITNIEDAITRASANRARLVLAYADKLSQVNANAYAEINLNTVLSKILMSFSKCDRAKKTTKLLSDLIMQSDDEQLLISGIEILFDRSLSLDPVRLLKNCSRHKTLLVRWAGDWTGDGLSYAIPSHPEYRLYKHSDLKDIVLVRSD